VDAAQAQGMHFEEMGKIKGQAQELEEAGAGGEKAWELSNSGKSC
jgi:hypothetical protein